MDEAFAFTGRWFDPDTGLQHNTHRWYDPTVGRWLNEDPIAFAAGHEHLYSYVGNTPTTKTDPSGLVPPQNGPDEWIRRPGGPAPPPDIDLRMTPPQLPPKFPPIAPPAQCYDDIPGYHGFWDSIGDSIGSMRDGLTGIILDVWGYDGEANRYYYKARKSGPYGQTEDSEGLYYYGPRIAMGGAYVGGGAATVALVCPTVNVGWKGGEIIFKLPGKPTPDFRINPFGGSGYPPHYHRRPGIGHHRPWDGGF